ncbi:Uncharacterized protein BM_BM8948 [Brugia malayi]|uniref:Bm8948 n=1 Tax=Brugia malayi TaxID=6279 RepID=A0A0J9XNP7_BRUMA|nr:Uncharacterized protein BM_BM8948 [Brugia malayi]CDP92334.1 Bm8948 [Brugia malayi]VIO94383.1 Uncharacterized protein BM_BM8948 [Brugia malayi]
MDVWYCQGFPVVPRDIYVVWRVLRLQGRGWPCLRCVGNASIFGEGDLSKIVKRDPKTLSAYTCFTRIRIADGRSHAYSSLENTSRDILDGGWCCAVSVQPEMG